MDFAEKLEEERDKVYKELKETKKAYDARCETLETRRSRKERAFDGEKSKASSSYEKHLHEANNAKVHPPCPITLVLFEEDNLTCCGRIRILSKCLWQIDIKRNIIIKTFQCYSTRYKTSPSCERTN